MTDDPIHKLNSIIKENSAASVIATGFGLTALLFERKEVILTGGRLITSVFQKRFQEQLASELFDLATKGGLKEEPYKDPNIVSTFLLLQKEIDENPEQQSRLNAMKALFVACSKKETSDNDVIMLHQLAQKAKNLLSMDLIVLKTCYFQVLKNDDTKYHGITYTSQWKEELLN